MVATLTLRSANENTSTRFPTMLSPPKASPSFRKRAPMGVPSGCRPPTSVLACTDDFHRWLILPPIASNLDGVITSLPMYVITHGSARTCDWPLWPPSSRPGRKTACMSFTRTWSLSGTCAPLPAFCAHAFASVSASVYAAYEGLPLSGTADMGLSSKSGLCMPASTRAFFACSKSWRSVLSICFSSFSVSLRSLASASSRMASASLSFRSASSAAFRLLSASMWAFLAIARSRCSSARSAFCFALSAFSSARRRSRFSLSLIFCRRSRSCRSSCMRLASAFIASQSTSSSSSGAMPALPAAGFAGTVKLIWISSQDTFGATLPRISFS
mmetsp:Transcript_6344/g.25575  ORF Transcript_6344/g.25575 Transcript_6344/m.25575 type:complete len:329 (-) Transcript_6344:3338-4324(-)